MDAYDLISELHFGLNFGCMTNAQLLDFCALSMEDLERECANRSAPEQVLRLKYYIWGQRALRARTMGRIPDGSVYGREV